MIPQGQFNRFCKGTKSFKILLQFWEWMSSPKRTNKLFKELEKYKGICHNHFLLQKSSQAHRVNMFLYRNQLKAFQGIVDGEYDDLPEQAFYMVGTIEEVIEKAKTM